MNDFDQLLYEELDLVWKRILDRHLDSAMIERLKMIRAIQVEVEAERECNQRIRVG